MRLHFSEAAEKLNDACCGGTDKGLFLIMRYAENVSDRTLYNDLNNLLREPLIGPTGEMASKSWGLQEMKAYASFLAGVSEEEDKDKTAKFFVNPNEDGESENNRPAWLWYGNQPWASDADEYCGADVNGNAGTKRDGSLTLRLALRKARLLQVVTDQNSFLIENGRPKWAAKGVWFTDSSAMTDDGLLKEIRETRPSLLLFASTNTEKVKRYVSFVARNHRRLPGRLLLSATKDLLNLGSYCKENYYINGNIREIVDGKSTEAFLPQRRLFWTERRVFKNNGGAVEPNLSPTNGAEGDWTEIESFLATWYAEYIKAFAAEHLSLLSNSLNENAKEDAKKGVNVGIYYDKPIDDNIAKRWVAGAKKVKNLSSFDVRVTYRITEDGQPQGNTCENYGWIVFDNHGRAGFAFNGDRLLFAQRTGSPAAHVPFPPNDAIERLLRNVPTGVQAVLTLLWLVESSLAIVAVLDERVNNALYKIEDSVELVHQDLQHSVTDYFFKSHVNPVTAFCSNGTKHWCFGGSGIKTGCVGWYLSQNGCSVKILAVGSQYTQKMYPAVMDAFVLHSGFIQEKKVVPNELAKQLYDVAARVVWSTGRSRAGQADLEAPVLEASALEYYLTREFSKYHLFRQLNNTW